jgi:hypothetical protein
MRELGFPGGERPREPKDLDDEVMAAHAAVRRRPRTGALRETRYRRAIHQSRSPFTACGSCVTRTASEEVSRR